jgi:hypothetical protein
MGIRNRKNLLITVMRARALAAKMQPQEVAGFELMYRRARTEKEQDQVTAAIKHFIHGWKDAGDDFSRLLRTATEFDDFLEDADSDGLPASIAAALGRADLY